MILFPLAARTQTGSPYTKAFQCRTGAARFVLNYTAESAGTMTLDCKLQYWTGTAWADLVTSAEAGIDFVQFTGVAVQTLTVGPEGPAEELAVVPTLFALFPLPRVLRAVATVAGGAGGDTVTFSLTMEELGVGGA